MATKQKYFRPYKNRRALGLTIDLFMLAFFTKSTLIILGVVLNLTFSLISSSNQRFIYENIMSLPSILLMIYCLAYFHISIKYGKGQTIGKIITKTAIVHKNREKEITTTNSLLRSVGYLIYISVTVLIYSASNIFDSISFLYSHLMAITWVSIPLMNKGGIGIQDLISNTRTVITEPMPIPAVIYLPNANQQINDDKNIAA